MMIVDAEEWEEENCNNIHYYAGLSLDSDLALHYTAAAVRPPAAISLNQCIGWWRWCVLLCACPTFSGYVNQSSNSSSSGIESSGSPDRRLTARMGGTTSSTQCIENGRGTPSTGRRQSIIIACIYGINDS